MKRNDESQEDEDSSKRPGENSGPQQSEEQAEPLKAGEASLVPASKEHNFGEKSEIGRKGNASSTANGPALEAIKVHPPKGKLSGGFLAAAIVASVLALVGLACGIARTALTSRASASSSQRVDSVDSSNAGASPSSTPSAPSGSSSSSSSSQTSQNSSSSGSTSTVAQSVFNATANMCEPSENTSSDSNSSTLTQQLAAGFNVSGTAHWGSVLSCVALNTFMPSTAEAKLKSLVDQAAVAYNSGSANAPNQQAISWVFGDKSKIYAYYAPGQGNDAWSIDFNTVPETSQSSGDETSIPIFPAANISDAVMTLQSVYSQCSTAGDGSNNLQATSSPSSDSLVLAGGSDWGPVLTCIAQYSSMPNAIQNNIKSAINNYASSSPSAPNPTTLNWDMKDGTKLYASYSGGEDEGEWLFVLGSSAPPTGWDVG